MSSEVLSCQCCQLASAVASRVTACLLCNPIPPCPPTPPSPPPTTPPPPLAAWQQALCHVSFVCGSFHNLLQRTLHEECSLFDRDPAHCVCRRSACTASNPAIAGQPIKASAAPCLYVLPMRHPCYAGDQLLFPSVEAALLHIQEPGVVDC